MHFAAGSACAVFHTINAPLHFLSSRHAVSCRSLTGTNKCYENRLQPGKLGLDARQQSYRRHLNSRIQGGRAHSMLLDVGLSRITLQELLHFFDILLLRCLLVLALVLLPRRPLCTASHI